MAKLSAAQRKKVPKSEMGLPGEGKYPMPDASHAANAKARASQQVNKGNLSPAQKSKIDAKANAILKRKRGAGVNIAKATSNIKGRLSQRSKKTQIGF